jgi:hypothetical protein
LSARLPFPARDQARVAIKHTVSAFSTVGEGELADRGVKTPVRDSPVASQAWRHASMV